VEKDNYKEESSSIIIGRRKIEARMGEGKKK
jgi:hypothetical protein